MSSSASGSISVPTIRWAVFVDAEGSKNAQRVLRGFVVFSDHTDGTCAGRAFSGDGAGFLRARLGADGFHVPAGETEAPAP